MQRTKPFFLALETVLKSRLPPDAFAQVMEESLWEFEAGIAGQEADRRPVSMVRLGSICMSFYRAMIKIGIHPGTALEALKQAGERLGWSAHPDTTSAYCSLANYFRSKNALPICQAVFCNSCPAFRKGCTLATKESADWNAAGKVS